MPKHGKSYRNKIEGFDKSVLHSLEEGVEKALSMGFAKFDETFDIAMKLRLFDETVRDR